MLRLHWVMALVMLIPMILGIAVPMMMVKNYPDMSAELAEDTEKLNASANEFITAMPVIKMYHLTAEKFEQYRNALHLYTTCWKKMCVSSCNPLSIALVVLDSAILFTLPFGGWLYSKGSLSVASYLLFILLTMCFFTSFLNLVTIVMQSMELGSGLDNIKKIMDMDEMKSGSKTLKKDGCYGIDFEDVTFNYTSGRKRRAHFCKPALGAGNGQRLCRPVRGWKDNGGSASWALLGHHRRNHQSRWSTNY